jgi:hypothetical protein
MWCWRGTEPAIERRGIAELIGSGRRLRNQGVQKINRRLQLRTPIVLCHYVECKSEEESVYVMEGV